jgi:ribosomal protein S14
MIAHEQSSPQSHAGARGVPVRGDFRCRDCGYGVSVVRALPHCPMCGASAWEPAPRTRLRRFQLPAEPHRSAPPATPPAVVSGRCSANG